MRALLRSPALHMAAIGGLMFAVTALRGGVLVEERPRIEIPQHLLDGALQAFVEDNRRAATDEERAAMLDTLIDQEVLYQYALALGMHDHPAARRRLAQIAEFVEANPHHATSEDERVEAAIEMGLHHGDLVVRRILMDSARRLIRAVVLLQEPGPEQMVQYLAAHGDQFARPARSRISQVAVNGFKWPDTAERARRLLARIEAESLDAEAAVALGDEAFVAPHLPPLTEQALATKLSAGFAAEAIELPAGAWAGPIASRYGHHLVFVHERFDAYVPPIGEIRDSVKQRLLHKLADEWLALRLKELRLEYEIVTTTRVS